MKRVKFTQVAYKSEVAMLGRPQDVGKISGRRLAIATTECRRSVPQGEFISSRIKRRYEERAGCLNGDSI